MNKIEATKKAIDEAGGQTRMARKLAAKIDGLTQQKALYRLQKWAVNGVPPPFVLAVEEISGVSRHDLSPDIYPREQPIET